MEQFIGVSIMVLATVVTTLLLLFPIKFKFGTKLVKFYWRGLWCFLAMIAIVAGSGEVLKIMGFDFELYVLAALSGLMSSYILFVMFAWFRLVAFGFFAGLRRLNKTV